MARVLEIPFYFNQGYNCGQVVLKCGIEAIYPDLNFSLGDLERMTCHNGNELTFMCQIGYALQQMNLPFRYFSKKGGMKSVLENNFDDLIKKNYAPYHEEILKKLNQHSIKRSVESLFRDNRVIETDAYPSREDFEGFIDNENIPLVLINYDLFLERDNKYNGHYIIITGMNESKDLVYHDTGPRGARKNKKMNWDKFEKIRDLCFFDHGLIVLDSLK